jgi:Recombination endonuclease VII
MIKFKKISKGQTFGRLTTLRLVPVPEGSFIWECRCACGKICIAAEVGLIGGCSESCGCLKIERFVKRWKNRREIHGITTTERLPRSGWLWLLSIKNKYGLSPKQWTKLVLRANGHCELCLVQFKNPRQCCIDHDHKTGKVRGLLCVRCNLKLGILEHGFGVEKFLESVRKYLKHKF